MLSFKSIFKRIKRRFLIFYDFLKGYDFLTVIPPEKLGLGKENVNRGSPSGNLYLQRVLESLNISRADNILDIGCAKGSALKMFCKFPFGKITGLELSEFLLSICKKNFKKFGDSRIELVCSDAETYRKYGEHNYFYLYNPFRKKEILERVVKNIIDQCCTRITVIYNNPFAHEVFIENGFNIVNRFKNEWDGEIIVLEFVPL